jgi:hypothetical protein
MYSCIDCGNLDKTRKKTVNGHVNYGCNALENGYTCGWVSSDSELKNQGCSRWVEKVDNQMKMEV